MAKKYHPDLNKGDANAEQMFKDVNEAYSVLSDPQKKARYDQYGHAGVGSELRRRCRRSPVLAVLAAVLMTWAISSLQFSAAASAGGNTSAKTQCADARRGSRSARESDL